MFSIKKHINKYINYFNSLNKPVKASIAFTICHILTRSLSTITLPLFTRILTPAQYGVLSVYNSWYAIIQIFATLNIFLGVFNNGMIKYEDDRDRFQSSMIGLTNTLTFIVFIIYLCFRNFWNQYLQLNDCLMVVMFLQLLFTPAFNFWHSRQRFEFEYKNIIIVTLLSSIIRPIIAFIAVINTEYKAEARVIAFESVAILVGLYFYITTLKKGRTFFDKKYWSFALAFNLPLVFHYLSGIILNQSDRIMINNMVGRSEAAIYSVAYNLSFVSTMITSSINSSLVPYTYRKIKDKDYEPLRKSTNQIIYLVSFCIFLIILFGPEIIRILAAKAYYDAIWVIPPVATSVLITFINSFFTNVEFYFEKNKMTTVASCVGAVLNIILNYIFIPKYGYLAAGYTTLICYLAFILAHYYYYRKIMKENNIEKIYDDSHLWKVIVMVLGAMFIILSLYNHLIIRYAIILIMFITICFRRKKIVELLRSLKE